MLKYAVVLKLFIVDISFNRKDLSKFDLQVSRFKKFRASPLPYTSAAPVFRIYPLSAWPQDKTLILYPWHEVGRHAAWGVDTLPSQLA